MVNVNIRERACGHWSLLVVHREKREVFHYDSYFKNKDLTQRQLNRILPLLKLLEEPTSVLKKKHSFTITQWDSQHKQPNCYDCGVVLALYIEFLLFKREPNFVLDQACTNQMRVKMLLRLLSGVYNLEVACNCVDTKVGEAIEAAAAATKISVTS
jgi:Ulp1 family protease